jgi:glycosyltransferase involved in cell wall biosynthesis
MYMREANRKIKIAYFIQDLHTGGAEKLLLDLIAHLDTERFEIILITMHNRGELFSHLPAVIHKTYCTANPVTLYRILKKERPDVFHSHLWRGDLIGIPIARLAGVKRIFSTKHNVNYFCGIKNILVPWDILAMRLASKVIAISKAAKDFYQRNPLYKNVAFEVVSNGVDIKKFSRCHKKNLGENSAVNILTVATLKRKKGHVHFLEILKRLCDVDYVWHLVGDGPEKKHIQQKASQLGILDRIKFHGIQEDTLPFYEQADVFALPSLWEGLPLVLIEAMAAGVPVMASEIEATREILEDGKTGMLFDIHNPEESAAKIMFFLKEILQDAQRRETMAACAKHKAAQYSIETMARKYTNLYTDAVGSNE